MPTMPNIRECQVNIGPTFITVRWYYVNVDTIMLVTVRYVVDTGKLMAWFENPTREVA